MKIAVIGIVGVPASYGGFETLVENLIEDDTCSYTVYCSASHYSEKSVNYKNARLVYLPLRANGLQCRDYIYGTDLCALITVLAKRNNYSSPPIINICSGKSYNALEICDLIYTNLGMQPTVNYISSHDDFEVNNSRLDNTLLTSLLSELNINQLFKPLENTLPIFLQTESIKTGQDFKTFM